MPRKIKRKDREKFLEVLAGEAGMAVDSWAVQHFGKLMMRHAATYSRYCEKECNEPMTGQDHCQRKKAAERIWACCDKLTVLVKLQHDPRGFTVKLMTPKTGKFNTLGGAEDGWGVPTS